MSETFDVFLSHNSKDKPAVRELRRALQARGLNVWLDESELTPGRPWQEELEEIIATVPTAAVLVGKDGLGPWEVPEMRACLEECVRRGLPVIPVLLPGCSKNPELPLFLRRFTWVDLRDGITEERLDRLYRGITSKPQTPEAPALIAYRDWAREHYRGLNLLGLGGGDVRMRFEEVYVPLRIAQRPERIGMDGPDGKGIERLRLESLEDLKIEEVFKAPYAAGRHALVLGHPGAGKSTALLKLLHQCLTQGPESLGLAAGTVPVFLRLRRLTTADLETDRPLAVLLARELAEVSGETLPEDLAEILWQHGRLLLLLDGLDEIADESLRAGVCQALDWELADGDRRVRAVVSCRFVGYGGRVQVSDRFLPLEVKPLDAEQCRNLVRLWFREAPRALLDFPEAEARRAAERLAAALDGPDYGTQAWKVLIGSPLLLTLLCVIVLRGGQMPRQRVAFYDESLRVLLGRWGRAKQPEAEGGGEPPLDVETAFAVLRFLAWTLHARGSRDDLTWLEALDLVEERLAVMGKEPNGFPVLAWLHREAGVLAEYAPREYGFLHLGLQEYLTALGIASRGGEALLDELASHWDEEWWHEVILLLVGMPGRRLFGLLMDRLLASPALLAREDLLRACLEETAEVDLEPFLACLGPSEPPERQAAVLRLVRGRSDPRFLEPALELQGSPHPDVAALAEQLVAELSGPRSASSQATVDLFLVYHMDDQEGAAGLAHLLERAGVRVARVTEEPLTEALVEGTRAVAVLAGPSGRLPWELPELQRCLRLFARRRRLFVPVQLPGSGDAPTLPRDLPDAPWIDLRSGLSPACVTTVRRALAQQPAAPEAKGSATEGKSFTEPLTGLRFLWIPGGRFQMGGTAYPDEQPVHWVRISPFWLAETPVTNRQYAVFPEKAGAREPDYWRGKRFSAPEQPVVGVSWEDTQEFCAWLSKESGWRVLLPSEAQWEFAARGTEGREYPWGNEPPDETRACFRQQQTAPVGSYPTGRGPFGTFDQAGNVWEWCRDAWDENAYAKPEHAAEAVEPVLESKNAERRVLRGGGWFSSAERLRAASCRRSPVRGRGGDIGFRVAAVPPSTLKP